MPVIVTGSAISDHSIRSARYGECVMVLGGEPVTVTVWPDVIDTEFRMISVADVPTVSPVTTTVPAWLRISASAAVPVADAVADSGVPAKVATAPDMVNGVAGRGMVTNTPVAPDSAEVPITSELTCAVPVDAVNVLLDTTSLINCIRLVLSVAL
jgi:hypothetical protein